MNPSVEESQAVAQPCDTIIHRPLAVLIVAYRTPTKLEKCLASTQHFLPGVPIHVWDNSGPDFAGVRELARFHPDVRWYVGGENLGFAAAVNRLAEKVPGHDFLLLNPDAELQGPLSLTRAAAHETGVAAASPMYQQSGVDGDMRRTKPWDRRQLPWDLAYRRLTLTNAFGHAVGLSKLLRGSWFSQQYRSRPSEVDGFISGCCLLINREAWDRIGPFDEEFFMYQEESEWQRRALDAGWIVRLGNEIGFRHQACGTVADDPHRLTRSQELAFANAVLMVEYCFGRRTAEAYLAFSVTVDEVKRRILRRGRPMGASCNVMMTADGGADALRERVAVVLTLVDRGHSVCVISLQRLRILQRQLPPSVRLIRRPWWWPLISPQPSPSVLLTGSTPREKAFGRMFKFSHPRTSVSALALAAIAIN